ncbi:FixH family protein [Sporosarcina sp. 179-K 3D1 HS]|uniref:FixH family protein n=1 Tax=Sporosarcina sp. 179-K 3D1 HS TaxID=3232169 RepID=UPI0039A1CF56
MKKFLIPLFALLFLLSGCGSSKVDFAVEQSPDYRDGETSEMIIRVTEGDEPVSGLSVLATLEMAKMDHGVIEVHFDDIGDGLYSSHVELPMGGEWIATVQADTGKKVLEEVVTFDVKEG